MAARGRLVGTFVNIEIAYLFPLGVSVRRHEKGLWLGVESVRDDAAAKKGGLMKGDFITAINGRIVFHMKPEDVSRLIRNSGKV